MLKSHWTEPDLPSDPGAHIWASCAEPVVTDGFPSLSSSGPLFTGLNRSGLTRMWQAMELMAHHTCISLRALQEAEPRDWQGPWHRLDTIPKSVQACGTCLSFLASWVLTGPYGTGTPAHFCWGPCQGGANTWACVTEFPDCPWPQNEDSPTSLAVGCGQWDVSWKIL